MNKIISLIIVLLVCLSACNTEQQNGEDLVAVSDASSQVASSDFAESSQGLPMGNMEDRERTRENFKYGEKIPDEEMWRVYQASDIFNMYEWMEEKEKLEAEKNAPEPDEPGIWQEQGLTKKEWEEFREQKIWFDALTDEGKAAALEGGMVMCRNFTHLWWEASISTEFIRYVGEDAFEEWYTEHRSSGECLSIYSFADNFGFDLDTLKEFIIENKLEEVYPLDRLEKRYNYFNREAVPDN